MFLWLLFLSGHFLLLPFDELKYNVKLSIKFFSNVEFEKSHFKAYKHSLCDVRWDGYKLQHVDHDKSWKYIRFSKHFNYKIF